MWPSDLNAIVGVLVMVLDNRVSEELKELYKSLEDQGKLLSREQLAEYYGTFRSRFGPDKLKNLDGEALLNLMHEIGNKISLVSEKRNGTLDNRVLSKTIILIYRSSNSDGKAQSRPATSGGRNYRENA